MSMRISIGKASVKWTALAVAIAVFACCLSGCTTKPTPSNGASTERWFRFTAANLPKLDPAIGQDEASAVAHVNLYDSLVFPVPGGGVTEWVATEWDVTPDGLQWTFTLRDDVYFHSGNELTAEDVVFSMERLLRLGQGWAYLFLGRVDRCEALDHRTVQFTLTEPFGPFLSILPRLYILDKAEVENHIQEGLYDEHGDYGTQWLVFNDAGSGPYKVKEFKFGEHFLMELHEDYWRPLQPNCPTMAEHIATNEAVTVRTLMSRQELEMSDGFQSIESFEALAQIPGVTVHEFITPPTGGSDLKLNNKKPPTDCVYFRKALAYCIDYDTIIDAISKGGVMPIGMVPWGLRGHNPDVEQPYYDLDKAREYLKKSKYYGKLDEYPMELAWVAEVPDREKIALLIQSCAEKIGIKANIVRVPWVTMTEMAYRPETTPNASIVGQSADYPEAGGYLYPRYHSSGLRTWIQMDWLDNPEVDRMIDEALRTVDEDERMAKYMPVQEELMDLQPSVLLPQAISRRAVQDYIIWPYVEARREDKPVHTVMGYSLYIADIEVHPEKMSSK